MNGNHTETIPQKRLHSTTETVAPRRGDSRGGKQERPRLAPVRSQGRCRVERLSALVTLNQ
jgi:hypothetical protein